MLELILLGLGYDCLGLNWFDKLAVTVSSERDQKYDTPK